MARRGHADGSPAGAEGKEEDAGASSPGRHGRGFAVGTAVGVTLAGLFNPVDRALYLSVVERRAFLSPLNFGSPWEGFREAVAVRTVTGGLFFPLFEAWQAAVLLCAGEHRPLACATVAGQLTGLTIGLLMNPINVVKHHMWGSSDRTFGTFRSTARGLWLQDGARAFCKGALATALRDATFGGIYGGGRRVLAAGYSRDRSLSRPEALALDLAAGSVATALSSPLNYARNLQFASSVPGSPAGIRRSLADLWAEALHAGRADARGRLLGTGAHLQARMRLGWGTARVGCGMALGQGMYDFAMGGA